MAPIHTGGSSLGRADTMRVHASPAYILRSAWSDRRTSRSALPLLNPRPKMVLPVYGTRMAAPCGEKRRRTAHQLSSTEMAVAGSSRESLHALDSAAVSPREGREGWLLAFLSCTNVRSLCNLNVRAAPDI